MKKSKLLCFVLALSLIVIPLTACGQQPETPSESPTESQAALTSEAPEPSESAVAPEETEPATADQFDPTQYSIAFATVLVNHPVLRIVELGFLNAAADLGYTDAQVVGPEALDFIEMNTAAEAFAASGGKGVALWAQDATCLPTIKTLNDQGVIVGVPHTEWKEGAAPGLDFSLACVPTTYAIACADFMAERLEGKTGSIAITQAAFNENEDAAAAAFITRIEEIQAEGKLQGIKVLEPVLEGAEDLTESTNVNASIIQANSDLIAAFGLTGNSPVTWANAAQKAGKEKGEILIVGMDYTTANLDLINDGSVTAIIAQPLYDEGYRAAEYIDKLLRGESVEYWTELDAPLVYAGGMGVNDPAHYTAILESVTEKFGE